MRPPPSLKVNFSYNLFLNLVNILYPVISFTYISKIFGPSILGKVSIATSLSAYFTLIACLGIPIYGTREIAKQRNNADSLSQTFSELFVLNLCASLLSFAAFIVLISITPAWNKEWLLFVICGISILSNSVYVDWYYQGMENYRYISIRNVIIKALSLVLLFVSIHKGTDYLAYAMIGAFANLGSNVFAFLKCRKLFRLKPGFSINRHIRPLLYISGSAITASMYVNLDTVLLGLLSNEFHVGLYTVAVRINKMIIPFISSIGIVLIPRLAFLYDSKNDEEFFRITRKSIQFIFLITIPLMILLYTSSPLIISLIAGEAFKDSVIAMRIIIPIIIIIGCTNYLGFQIILPRGEEKILFYSTLAAACLSIAGSLVLIPALKENGTAIATVAAEFSVLVVQYVFIRKKYSGIRIVTKPLAVYVIAGAAAGAVAVGINTVAFNPAISLLMQVSSGTACYAAVVLLFKDELSTELLRNIVSNVKKRIGYSVG